ncbi:MAG: S-layer homology domain-containing protein [Ruminococcaceae bacterium]|nr:S-layer homology domain-containing protein [Oscillospiraceae bacterium]
MYRKIGTLLLVLVFVLSMLTSVPVLGSSVATADDVVSVPLDNLTTTADASELAKQNYARHDISKTKNHFMVKGDGVTDTTGLTKLDETPADVVLAGVTADGLASIRKSIPGFEAPDFASMGTIDVIGGSAPIVSELHAKGIPVVGETLTASYTYVDADDEGVSKIYWYVSDKENGEYERILDGYGKYYTVPDDYQGKYLRFEVVPYDVTYNYNEAVVSEPILIEKTDNAFLADLKVNGKTVNGFSANKANYMITANAVPEVTALPAATGATVEITKNSNTLPVKFTITVTAIDGKTTKAYVLEVSSAATETPKPTPPSVSTTPSYNSGGSVGVGFVSIGSSSQQTTEKPVVISKFTDIIGHWAQADINEMAEKGIVSGVSKTTFEPERSITRAEFAAMMTRALNLTSANSDTVFVDVRTDAWYAKEVAAAAAVGLIVGYDGYFRPDDMITREEMAVVIMKVYDYLGKAPSTGKIEQFADKESISTWAYDYVDQAVSSNLISGMTFETFAPSENATRAQVTSLIKRLLNN